MGSRFAGMVLFALLSGQVLFGAAAVVSLALKEEPRAASASGAVLASGPTSTLVR